MEQGVIAVIGELERRGNELRQELAGVESDLDTARAFRDVLAAMDGSAFAAEFRKGTSEEKITDSIYQILSLEQPLHRAELFRRMEVANFHFGGQKPLDNFSGYLSKDPRFVSVGKGYWQLVESSTSVHDNLNSHSQHGYV